MKAFVTVGTDHHPFDRLSGWMDDAAMQMAFLEIHMQFGTSRPPARVSAVPYMPYEEMQRRMHDADVVICHGGPATIVEARAAGHRPIVVPRLPELGEHVDGHQVRFCTWMQARDQVLRVQRFDELLDALDRVAAGGLSLRTAQADDDHRSSIARFDTLVAPLLDEGAWNARRQQQDAGFRATARRTPRGRLRRSA